MDSVFDENSHIEAVLRTIATDIGAQVYRDHSDSLPSDDVGNVLRTRSTVDEDDEAEYLSYQRTLKDEVDLPPDVDLINTWEELRHEASLPSPDRDQRGAWADGHSDWWSDEHGRDANGDSRLVDEVTEEPADETTDEQCDRWADEQCDRWADEQCDRWADDQCDTWADEYCDRICDEMAAEMLAEASITAKETERAASLDDEVGQLRPRRDQSVLTASKESIKPNFRGCDPAISTQDVQYGESVDEASENRESVSTPSDRLYSRPMKHSSTEEGLESKRPIYDSKAESRQAITEPDIELNNDGLPAPHSCKHCEHVFVDISGHTSKREQSILFARSRKDLDLAADDGCILLSWLRWHLYERIMHQPSPESDIYLHITFQESHEGEIASIRIKFVDWGAGRGGRRGKGEFGPLSFVCKESNPSALHVRFRPVNLHVSSDKAFATARQWLDECQNHHPECRDAEKQYVPSKLLYISGNRVTLVETASISGDSRYVALSYCWGGEQEQKTVISNLEERQSIGIDIEQLPQTLKDAVTATRRLGLSYLWVDSLCIIQDDAVHRNQEIGRMADIYSGAFLTISAANSTSVHQGFLQSRLPSAIRKHIFPLRMLCANGDEGRLYIYRAEQHSPKREDALNSRGWTLQEYALSPRLLIYGSWQARWVCRSMQRWDGGPDGVYPSSFGSLATKLQFGRTIQSVAKEGLTALDEGRMAKFYLCSQEMDDIALLWPKIIEEYTQRKLTVTSDRASAIMGIASRYAKLSNHTYIGGLVAAYR